MASIPPSDGGILPDLSQNNTMPKANKHPLITTLDSNRVTAELQKGEGSTIATNRLEFSKSSQINAGPNRSTPSYENQTEDQIQTTHQVLGHTTVGIESTTSLHKEGDRTLTGEEEPGFQLEQNQCKMGSACLEMISEKSQQNFIETNSTTIKTLTPAKTSMEVV